MKRAWSKALTYDLTRTQRRASVPKAFGSAVPEAPGTYVIYCLGQTSAGDAILDIGECGPRPRSKPHGLRGRLASNVPHSASEQIALDIFSGNLRGGLGVVWFEAESKPVAKDAQDALVSIFRREFGKQPRYNRKWEHHHQPDNFEQAYRELKALVGCTA
jgi:hypothetical protein